MYPREKIISTLRYCIALLKSKKYQQKLPTSVFFGIKVKVA